MWEGYVGLPRLVRRIVSDLVNFYIIDIENGEAKLKVPMLKPS